jgi:cell division protein FtsB
LTPDACAFIPARTNQSFAWNHGDIQDEIASTWVGYVGQGIDGSSGQNSTIWSDHTDVRPTILSLVGLKDDYVHDGRVISEILQGYAQPAAMKKSTNFTALAQVYKQLNASFGAFAMAVLRSSTKALASNDAGDATYTSIESQIASLTSQRDALAAQIKTALNGAEFNGQVIGSAQAQSLINQGIALLNQASALPH